MRQVVLTVFAVVALTLVWVGAINRGDVPLIWADDGPIKTKPSQPPQSPAGERQVPPEYAALWERLNNWAPIERVVVTRDGKMIPVDIEGTPLPNRSPIAISRQVCGTALIQDENLLREAILRREPPEVIAEIVRRLPGLSL